MGNCCVYKQQLLWRIRKGEAGCLFELVHSSSASPVGLQSSRGKGALQHPRLFLMLSMTTWFHSVDTLRTSWFPQAAAGHLSTPPFTLHRIIGAKTRGSANWGSPPCSIEKHYKLVYEMIFLEEFEGVDQEVKLSLGLHIAQLSSTWGPASPSLCVPASCYSEKLLPLLYTAL